jgi:alpha-D-ribose 1-methylphosphonate 5-triphosphate synthase subunit PhnG
MMHACERRGRASEKSSFRHETVMARHNQVVYYHRQLDFGKASGRIGGDAPFNLGETTVSRVAVVWRAALWVLATRWVAMGRRRWCAVRVER